LVKRQTTSSKALSWGALPTPHLSKNTKEILLFSIIFLILQATDLILTQEALNNPGIRELNPFYKHPGFIIIKMGLILIIAPLLYYCNKKNYSIAKTTMRFEIGLYSVICLNNAIQVFS
jgi:hypothetical protein